MNPLRALAALSCLLAIPAYAAVDADAFKAAVDLYARRRPLEARQAFEALAAANPDHPDIQFYLGRLALQRDDHAKAVTHLEQAVALSPADSRYHHRLGDAYGRSAQKAGIFSKLGLAGKCRAEYERAVALDPKNLDARFSLLGFYQQAPAIAGGGLDKAHQQAQEIKRLDASRGRMAVAGLHMVEKKFDLAYAEFAEALGLNPDDYAALFQSGRFSAITGTHLEEGLAALRKCLTLAPPEGQPPLAAVHWRLGMILEHRGDPTGARAAYEAALKIDPQFPQAADSLNKLK